LIKWRIADGNWNRVTEFLDKPAVQKRATQLKIDVKDQFIKGNKGNFAEWIE
jgi:hypothetical protein